MDEILAIMLSWAVMLTGYPAPRDPPTVEMVPHAFLVAHACGGQACHVQGWYAGGHTVYLDDTLDPVAGLYDSSVLLHELVHFLQEQSRSAAGHAGCVANLAAEREAYGAQREYLLRYGVYRPVGSSMHHVGC